MIRSKLRYVFKNYFELLAFSAGLILLTLMDPANANGPDFCLFEQVGITFCPGDGLGHSISYTFNGQFYNALQANVLGPFAIVILCSRIIHLIRNKFKKSENKII